MKPDELEFLGFVYHSGFGVPISYWPDLTKRQYYLLEKWSDKGFWTYGVSVRSGRLTDQGKAWAESVLPKEPQPIHPDDPANER